MSRRPALSALLTAVALVVVGCSSGGGSAKTSVDVPNVLAHTEANAAQELASQHLVAKVSYAFRVGRVGTVVEQSPVAGRRVPSGSTVRITVLIPSPGGGTGPVDVAANLGPCPKHDPNIDLVKANAGVLDLNKRLVPVPATTVRICDYLYSTNDTPTTRLLGSRLLGRSGTQALEATTNSLPVPPRGVPPCPAPQTPEELRTNTFLLSFADTSQQVDVYAFTGRCADGVLNGKFQAILTTAWLKQVLGYAHFNAISQARP